MMVVGDIMSCEGGFRPGINIPFFLYIIFSAVTTDFIYLKRIIKTIFFYTKMS